MRIETSSAAAGTNSVVAAAAAALAAPTAAPMSATLWAAAATISGEIDRNDKSALLSGALGGAVAGVHPRQGWCPEILANASTIVCSLRKEPTDRSSCLPSALIDAYVGICWTYH